MKVTVFGSSGLLGKALMHEWSRDEVTGLTSQDADIRDRSSVNKIVDEMRPEWIVLSAAYTDVDGSEAAPSLAFSVNLDGAVNVAQAAKRTGAKLLFLSTDYVFDGKKGSPYETDDPRNPQSVYGRSKSEAEMSLLEILPDCCIARTSWLFGMGGKCFPDTILKAAMSRPVLDVVTDQRGSPTYTVDLSKAIMQLCRLGATGIMHVTNEGDCTWFEFASEILSAAGLPVTVRPSDSRQMARRAPRPAYSVLSSKSLRQFGIVMPTWHDALRRYLRERQAESIVQ
jgi:dTDP-4-dehydrorhamnose reductase